MPNKRRRPHLTQRGVFKSDKYGWCKAGFLVLKFTDPMAQDLIADYADRRVEIDQEFSEDVMTALDNVGFFSEEYNPNIFTRFINRIVSVVRWRPSQSAT